MSEIPLWHQPAFVSQGIELKKVFLLENPGHELRNEQGSVLSSMEFHTLDGMNAVINDIREVVNDRRNCEL